jgi:hypothetical protein
MGTYKEKNMLVYRDEAIGFSISYPDNWKEMSESSAYLVGFVVPDTGLGFQTNYLVKHQEVSVKKNLNEYFAKVERELQKKLKKYEPISEEEITIDGMPAKKHIYTHSEKKITYKQMLICLKQGKVGWVVVLASSVDAFETYRPAFEAIMTSFHLFDFNRGEDAKFIYSKAFIKSDIREWGIAFIIIGIIQLKSPIFLTWWGGFLIILGLLELFVQRRFMYIINSLLIITAGILNCVAATEEGAGIWGVFAILQFIWGIIEFRKFFKYQTRAPGRLVTVANGACTSVQHRGVGIESTQTGVISAAFIQPKLTMVESGKPKIAGILSIIAGAIGLMFWGIGFVATVSTASESIGLSVVYAILTMFAVAAIVGGIYSIKRIRWGFALGGAICSMLVFCLLGIPAVILVALSKKYFTNSRTASFPLKLPEKEILR